MKGKAGGQARSASDRREQGVLRCATHSSPSRPLTTASRKTPHPLTTEKGRV